MQYVYTCKLFLSMNMCLYYQFIIKLFSSLPYIVDCLQKKNYSATFRNF